ncbi:LysR family transcriptional regulator [Alkalihalobacillus sp. AL-G]|uniref:LysR family transcriptional regulator n=1 Tax=Alkalihalobacillus sp. AL-G TaxID=2926399 RepID=UPI00272C02BD|nr:LysR family transcriptional regulator [Alkalihalobacillus sp. AL-G]WLD93796.1 LysR family transcriptional regulator [Alkalihalobacillus sp. AL-G]
MDIESLKLFLQIARHGSINKAANAMFLAQSTATNRLKQLEKSVGSPLFTRASVGVTLTAEGKRLLPIAIDVVEKIKAYKNLKEKEQTLTMVAGKALAAYELPRLISQYRKFNPHFKCYARSTSFNECVTAILSGSADIAFLGGEVYHPDLHQEFLPEDRIVLVTSRDHEWTNGFPGFKHWGSQEVITFGNDSAPFRKQIDLYLAKQGVFPNVIMELDSLSAVKEMVKENLGISMLPERTILHEKLCGSLAVLDVAEGRLLRPTVVVYPHYKKDDKVFQDFIHWIRCNY